MSTNYKPQAQVPSVFHKKIGGIIVTVLSDGNLELPLDAFFELEKDEPIQILREHLQAVPPYMNTNGFIVNNNGNITLVDTGFGSSFGPGAGHLIDNLIAAGYSTKDVDTVLLTHMHPDHVNGLLLADGTRAFPNAKVIVHEKEYGFWMKDNVEDHFQDDLGKMSVQMARSALAPYKGDIVTFSDSVGIPGISPIEAHGHTPGHTAYLIESEGDRLLIWGDIIQNATIQMSQPELKFAMDIDADQASRTRIKLLDFASEERIRVTGMHMDFPAFGYVKKEGSRYTYVPEQWRANDL
ncbi:MBL fold metallo-hydrolase [Paenibacillus sp. NPDC056722]|uniref:MBL fold metallo-hydrolase n=1 Tax=Paenibacillus sp. NPDC056722 TaxID=3345924 RepID=UPI0036B9C94B